MADYILFFRSLLPPPQWRFLGCGESAKLSALQCLQALNTLVILYRGGLGGFLNTFTILCEMMKKGRRGGGWGKQERRGGINRPGVGLYSALSNDHQRINATQHAHATVV